MEAVGQLVAGVAHNFNNLLTITMGYADLLADKYQGDAEARLALEEIRKATSRGAALTRQLLAFSRQREAAGTWVDVNPALLDLKDLLVRLVREDVTLTIEAAATPARAQVDVQEFEQAILNLVINARDALPSGGHIWITVSNEVIDAPLAISDLTLQPGPYVCVQVRDDGVGMPPEVQAHLFEPFFTTKDVGKGTGLGLASIYGLARRHRGAIGIDSAPGQGTTVTLYFPSARRADGDAPGRSEPAGGSRRGLDTSPEQPN
jgi:signal transduction histidine kinase